MGTPFKMKGSPMQRNFGIGSPLRQEEKEMAGEEVKKEVKTGSVSDETKDTDEAAITAWNAKWGDRLKVELEKQAAGDKTANLEFISAARSALQEIAGGGEQIKTKNKQSNLI